MCILSQTGRLQAEAALAARTSRGQQQVPTTRDTAATADTTPTPALPRSGNGLLRMIHPPAPDALRRSTLADRTRDAIPGDGDVPERLAELKQALATLASVSQSLTRDVFARVAGDPAHAEQYEQFVRAINIQASEIRKQAQRAPRAG
ncbi:hypothetical protein [Streptomyces sp. NPDC093097]|uniref:hypothetical protein n=1 Tax=Streptomyces sp. NPDC093097 TaxID=3366027 RepID=UPI0037FEA247